MNNPASVFEFDGYVHSLNKSNKEMIGGLHSFSKTIGISVFYFVLTYNIVVGFELRVGVKHLITERWFNEEFLKIIERADLHEGSWVDIIVDRHVELEFICVHVTWL